MHFNYMVVGRRLQLAYAGKWMNTIIGYKGTDVCMWFSCAGK